MLKQLCICCGKPITDHTNVINHNPDTSEPVTPKPGDVTFCAYCGAMYEFSALIHGVLEYVYPDREYEIFIADPQLHQIANKIRSMIKKKINGQ